VNWSASTENPSGQGGIVVNVPSREALLEGMETRLRAGQGFSVATLNLDHVVKLRRDPAFRAAYARQSHVTADGNPIVWLSRLSGRKVRLAPGSELVEPAAGLAARLGLPVAFVGSTAPALERAAERLAARHPELNVVSRIAPAMGFDPEGHEADVAIDALGRSGARVAFLALGAPRQEIFAARAQERLPQTGFLSIGAGLDFVAGTQTRAPAFVRAVAAEWLWRLATDPGRLARRYGACIVILPGLTWAAWRERGRA